MNTDNAALANPQDMLEVITFEADGARYAVPIGQVRYIQKDNVTTTRIDTDKGAYQVVRFEGQPVPVLDFADWTGGKAVYRANQELIGILEQREKDHIDWVDALETSLRSGTAFTRPRDPQQCAFGKWYETFTTEDDMLAELMREFDEPHRRIHALADRLLAVKEQQGQQAALEILQHERHFTLERLKELFADAKDRLRSITRPVLVYLLKKDGKLVAIRLNGLSDIETYSWADFSPYEPLSSAVKPLPIIQGYLQARKNVISPLVLLDFNRLP